MNRGNLPRLRRGYSAAASVTPQVLVKRGNRLKFNSHEWYLKGLIPALGEIDYCFLTDAGTGFDKHDRRRRKLGEARS